MANPKSLGLIMSDRWPALMDKPIAAEYLSTSVRTIERMMADGELKPVKFRGEVRFRKVELDEFINKLPRDIATDIEKRNPRNKSKKHDVQQGV